MAKKKNKNSNLGKLLSFVALVLGAISVAMIFVSAVTSPDVETSILTIEGTSFTGLQIVFGYTENKVECLLFSFVAMLPYLLALAGTVLTALNAFNKKPSKLSNLISAISFVAAGVMFFLIPNFMVFGESFTALVLAAIEWKLAIGSIIAGACSILAGSALIVKAVK